MRRHSEAFGETHMTGTHTIGTKNPSPNYLETFPPLEQVTRSHVPTGQAAHYLCRRPQTLREWACLEAGPLRPHRVNGRLAWKVDDIRRILGVSK